MTSDRTVVYYGAGRRAAPQLVNRFCEERGLDIEAAPTEESVHAILNRAVPACLVADARDDAASILQLCRELKQDPFTALVPVVIVRPTDNEALVADGLAAGADEVISEVVDNSENWLRLRLVLDRASRDVNVHPTTRLPGTVQIERDMAARMAAGRPFAVCYADLDHFKEFNDRYGYNNGDKVILLLSRMLREIVRALAPTGFVGHIGGDDFIFIVPLRDLEACCDEIVNVFDELIPYQYSEEDRKVGYFLGKDRRGSIHRIPLMTLSIGVVTNQFQVFTHTAQVSELAAEMKAYAKTLPGTVYVVDRRGTSPVREAS